MMYTSLVQHTMPYESSNGQHEVISISKVSAMCHPCFPTLPILEKRPSSLFLSCEQQTGEKSAVAEQFRHDATLYTQQIFVAAACSLQAHNLRGSL